MAKKKTAKKTTKQTSASGKSASRASASSAKKKSGKKTSSSKSGAGSTARAGARSTGAAVKKKSAQKATETKKQTGKKAPTKASEAKSAPKKPEKKPQTTKKPEKKPETGAKPQTAGAPKTDSGAEDKGRKGITVVEKKRSSRQKAPPVQFPSSGRLLAPGGPLRKPLIPSGPQNVVEEPFAADKVAPGEAKSPFNKRQLEKFRTMLQDKRRELLGDITGLESEALKSADGSDPRLGEHLEDQGSDAIDQAVSLDLAAADRRLLRMIDEALDRIDKGTYGLCVVTGNPIREERLRELPWASLSIEAARAEERRQMGRL